MYVAVLYQVDSTTTNCPSVVCAFVVTDAAAAAVRWPTETSHLLPRLDRCYGTDNTTEKGGIESGLQELKGVWVSFRGAFGSVS